MGWVLNVGCSMYYWTKCKGHSTWCRVISRLTTSWWNGLQKLKNLQAFDSYRPHAPKRSPSHDILGVQWYNEIWGTCHSCCHVGHCTSEGFYLEGITSSTECPKNPTQINGRGEVRCTSILPCDLDTYAVHINLYTETLDKYCFKQWRHCKRYLLTHWQNPWIEESDLCLLHAMPYYG